MLTATAARASRSPQWVGLGHVPVLMCAATAAVCIVPLGVAKPGIGPWAWQDGAGTLRPGVRKT